MQATLPKEFVDAVFRMSIHEAGTEEWEAKKRIISELANQWMSDSFSNEGGANTYDRGHLIFAVHDWFDPQIDNDIQLKKFEIAKQAFLKCAGDLYLEDLEAFPHLKIGKFNFLNYITTCVGIDTIEACETQDHYYANSGPDFLRISPFRNVPWSKEISVLQNSHSDIVAVDGNFALQRDQVCAFFKNHPDIPVANVNYSSEDGFREGIALVRDLKQLKYLSVKIDSHNPWFGDDEFKKEAIKGLISTIASGAWTELERVDIHADRSLQAAMDESIRMMRVRLGKEAGEAKPEGILQFRELFNKPEGQWVKFVSEPTAALSETMSLPPRH